MPAIFKDDPDFKLSDVINANIVLTYIDRWPLIVHILSAMFCLGCSSIFHLFQIHSKKWDELLSRLDYAGISVLIMGSSYPPIFYVFACKEVFWIRNIFLGLITTTCMCAFISTLHPVMNKPELRTCRSMMYVFLGLSAGAPFIYFPNTPESH